MLNSYNFVIMKKVFLSLGFIVGIGGLFVSASESKEDIFVVCYSGAGCYAIEDGTDCVSGLVDDEYFEVGCEG